VVEISFTDDGPGILEEHQEKMFDPFFTTKDVGKGTGLGLNISRRIVENHGGRIRVESGLGKGTTFVVQLPIADGGQTYAHVGDSACSVPEPTPAPLEHTDSAS
jgi:signal transduction histidine kinase